MGCPKKNPRGVLPAGANQQDAELGGMGRNVSSENIHIPQSLAKLESPPRNSVKAAARACGSFL